MPRRRREEKESYGGRSWWRTLFRILWFPLVRYLILTLIFLGIINWQWPNIERVALWIAELFGWGLALVAIALTILIIFICLRRLSSFFYHANRWLGGIALMLAAWGILAFYGTGGFFGDEIIGRPDLLGGLRVAGLVFVGLVLLFPRATRYALSGLVRWIADRFRKQPEYMGEGYDVPPISPNQPPRTIPSSTTPQPIPGKPLFKRPIGFSKGGILGRVKSARSKESVPLPSWMRPESPDLTPPQPPLPPTSASVEATADTAEATTETGKKASPAQQLKQVAEDVWKKYGQSADLVVVDGWKIPPLDILDVLPEVEFSQADNVKRAKLIEDSLGSYGVEAKVVQINAGPTVTQFGVEPGWDRKFKEVKEKDKNGNIVTRQEEVAKTRVKVERITSLANDLALTLAAPSIRIEAPVPGKSIVGIEVPNTRIGVVSLRGVIETSTFQKIGAKSRLALALGKGAGGEAVSGDLSKMPHLLIAGATGSGKTVCLNATITCLLMHNTPFDVRFIMVDPKRVELTPYNSLPHLATPVIVETDKALNALRWLNLEMDQRYKKMATAGARNIEGYNKGKQGKDKMPFLVLVIDELADLMMTGFDEVEHILCRLAQLARATGIHLVVATQRPSVDVVTGLIKANFPTRISFAVTSQVDSRTILDGAGAEKLLGRGDMLYMPTEAAKPKRLQGCFVSDPEIERLVYFWNSQQETEISQLKVEDIVAPQAAAKAAYPSDTLIDAARQLAREHERISTSFLQRRLHIGYPRAARIMEQLEEEGFKRGEEEGKPEDA